MIEKSFDKSYPIFKVNQSALTRIANRLLKEYRETFHTDMFPEEVTAAYKQIKIGEEAERYDDEYENEYACQLRDGRAYDTCHVWEQTNISAFFDKDEYGDDVYCVSWYFYSCETYKKYLNGKTIQATSYADISDKVTAAKGKYRYFCAHRPPARGCIPQGFVSYEVYLQGSRYCGEATYNEEPPQEELYNFGLIKDRQWEQAREFIIENLKTKGVLK